MVASQQQGVGLTTQNINKYKQPEPDNINKVPVPGRRFKAKTIICGEMTLQRTTKHYDQHKRAKRHVRTVEPSQHKECRSINA